jgi:adenosine deaminase
VLVNLHCHLEGTVRPETAAELAAPLGVTAPGGDWAEALTMAAPADLTVFLAHVAAVYPLLGSAEALERVACEAVEDAAADGQGYLELRFGPATHARPGFPVSEAIAAVCRGAAEGSRRSGILSGVVVCALRHHDPETNRLVAEAAAGQAGAGVVGFDLAGDELLYPSLEQYRPLFEIAAAAGLGLTAHAAEAGPAQSVLDAVDLFGTRRIGHGSRAADDPEVLRRAADEGVCFEVCVTSNILTGAARDARTHPVRRFLEHRCGVVLGDDDPITIRARLGDDVRLLQREGGLEDAQLAEIRRRSLEVAFLSDAERAELHARAATVALGPGAAHAGDRYAPGWGQV